MTRSEEIPDLFLARLLEAAPGLTPAFCAFLAEAAAVSCTEQGHQSDVALKVDGHFVGTYALFWETKRQIARADSALPGYVVVVEFGQPISLIAQL
jgi:hypothetical protein